MKSSQPVVMLERGVNVRRAAVRTGPTVLVTDGEQRAALAVVRSLGKAGYRTVVVGARSGTLAAASRYATGEAVAPDAQSDPAGYAATIEGLVRRTGASLLVPITEASALALLPARDRIPAMIPLPELDSFRAICDKSRVLSAAAEVGIRTPRQQELSTPSDGWDRDLRLPLVLKPCRSVCTAADGTRQKVGVKWAHSAQEVEAGLATFPEAAYPILVQEAVVGPGVGVFVLLHEGRLLASFAHRRLREKPPSGGVSVLRQSEPMDPDLLQRSLDLLRCFRWSGVAMVEYKVDERNGEAVLMEINGRFWGSLQLAIDAGVDFPRLLAAASLGSPPDPVNEYRFSVSRWFWGDVDNLIARWREKDAGWASRISSLAGWMRAFGPRYRDELFRWRDPAPAVRESLEWFKALRASR